MNSHKDLKKTQIANKKKKKKSYPCHLEITGELNFRHHHLRFGVNDDPIIIILNVGGPGSECRVVPSNCSTSLVETGNSTMIYHIYSFNSHTTYYIRSNGIMRIDRGWKARMEIWKCPTRGWAFINLTKKRGIFYQKIKINTYRESNLLLGLAFK